jgi:hypothetical protein
MSVSSFPQKEAGGMLVQGHPGKISEIQFQKKKKATKNKRIRHIAQVVNTKK